MKKSDQRFLHSLRRLAQMYGIQTSHYDVYHRRQHSSPEGLLAVLRALGAQVEDFNDVPNALRERQREPWNRCTEPVIVAWDGDPTDLQLRLPAAQAGGLLRCEWTLEDGGRRAWSRELADIPTRSESSVEGARYVEKTLRLPSALPPGYHKLALETGDRRSETLMISAPSSSYSSNDAAGRTWGVFLPLYALHSQRSWGGGDLADLEALLDWLTGLGGSVFGTLPLLASFLDVPFDASPYAPASRLFWNELYVDVTRIPELRRCPPAQDLLSSAEAHGELNALRSSPLVDYRRQFELKRKILSELASHLFSQGSDRLAALRRFADANPSVEDYARFRAAGELRRAPWLEWPSPAKDGILASSDFTEEAMRYHLYAQWVAHEQLQSISDRARQAGQCIYLDLPLGVHPASYDVWRDREAFALGAFGGAPPDAVFTKGQNWSFPPLHPQRIREQGYRYVIACLRHQMALASMLRVDHIMGLHRLFWIPKGFEPGQGAYVRYHAEELYAILNLESHRHKVEIVGENLGTVPSYVNATMSRHKIQRMYVVQYELSPEHRRALKTVPANAVASLNTHDMPPFTAFLRSLDLEDRLALGLLDERGVREEREMRESVRAALGDYLQRCGHLEPDTAPDAETLTRGCLVWLANSRARVVLVNLEDVWGETEPQNLPGTRDSHPNWRRKARYSLEEFSVLPEIVDTLHGIDRLRKSKKGSR